MFRIDSLYLVHIFIEDKKKLIFIAKCQFCNCCRWSQDSPERRCADTSPWYDTLSAETKCSDSASISYLLSTACIYLTDQLESFARNFGYVTSCLPVKYLQCFEVLPHVGPDVLLAQQPYLQQ